mmetsp:Transcript_210/g.544  ORF Transcript_210/g.544 Transcript_210/m.544 type:complete len:264 (+) Transcript_210:348-1139(+)
MGPRHVSQHLSLEGPCLTAAPVVHPQDLIQDDKHCALPGAGALGKRGDHTLTVPLRGEARVCQWLTGIHPREHNTPALVVMPSAQRGSVHIVKPRLVHQAPQLLHYQPALLQSRQNMNEHTPDLRVVPSHDRDRSSHHFGNDGAHDGLHRAGNHVKIDLRFRSSNGGNASDLLRPERTRVTAAAKPKIPQVQSGRSYRWQSELQCKTMPWHGHRRWHHARAGGLRRTTDHSPRHRGTIHSRMRQLAQQDEGPLLLPHGQAIGR